MTPSIAERRQARARALLVAGVLAAGCGGGAAAPTPGEAGVLDGASRDAGDGAAATGIVVHATVTATVDATAGVGGRLAQFMSTSFQPADWDYTFFQQNPDTTALAALGPRHIRVQAVDGSVPWRASSQPPQPSDWDFTELDAILLPILEIGDESPELQLAVAPALPGLVDASGHLVVSDANLTTLASYYANLVRYYNTAAGFDWGGAHFGTGGARPITFWGIFNEYNINGLTPAEYVRLYDAVVPAMLAVDPTLKLSAGELADYDYMNGDPRNNLPALLAPPSSGGLAAQIDILSTHFYGTCYQTDTDAMVFASVAPFVSDLVYIKQQRASRADLSDVPIWITENNVNSDFEMSDGTSACTPGHPYVEDARGSSPFFAAWRPYVFSQTGKAGAGALYQWVYADKVSGRQYGEVDFDTLAPRLGYWVDYWLGRMFPAVPGPSILETTTTPAGAPIELLATRADAGDVTIMVVDRAIRAAGDNNGPGDPVTVVLDLSALGAFSSASELAIDAETDVAAGPTAAPIPAAPQITVALPGYGVAFVTLRR